MSSILKIGSYRVKSTVRGYHVYGLHWKPVEGTLYRCQRELDNKYYSYAVAVYHDKPGTVVGHIPKEDAKLYSSLLQMQPPVTLHCMVIGKSFRRVNDGITELPCEYVFKSSSEENIQTIRNKLEASEGAISLELSSMIKKGIYGLRETLKIRRIVLYGPPGAGKTSIKRLMLDNPPLSTEEEQSTPLLEPPLRLITTDRITSTGKSNIMKVVSDEEVIEMVGKEVIEMVGKEVKLHEEDTRILEYNVVPRSAHQMPNQNQIVLSEPHDNANDVHADVEFHSQELTIADTLIRKIGNNLVKLNYSKVYPLYSVNWTHVIDSGGQPEFADLLPLVFPSEKNLYFVVFPLDQEFDEKPNSQYMIDGENSIKSPRQLALTHYEMIERMCQMAKLSKSYIKIIGTHLDCINEDTLKEKEKELSELKKKYVNVIIPNKNGTAILALNAVEKNNSKRAEYIEKLKEITLNGETWCVNESVPLSWIVLQLAMSRKSRNYFLFGCTKNCY